MDDFRDELNIEDFDENGEPILAKKKVTHGDDDEFEDDIAEDDLFGENMDVLGLSEEDFG
jgi:hypothetical protein